MRTVLAVIIIAVCVLGSCAGPVEPDSSTVSSKAAVHETSASFDLSSVVPFLERLDGLTADPHVVAEAIAEMDVDETCQFSLTFTQGPDMRLEVFLDDIDAPDLAFYGTEAQIAAVEDEFPVFFDELGQ